MLKISEEEEKNSKRKTQNYEIATLSPKARNDMRIG